MFVISLSYTCHGYSFTSVSIPPTILVILLAWPQLHVVVVVAVVLDIGLIVVVPGSVGAGVDVVLVFGARIIVGAS